MLAEPQVDGGIADFERAGHVGVEQLEVLADPVLRVLVQRPTAVLVLEVDEAGHAGERAEVAVLEVEVAGELGGIADDAAVVVPVAVVVVERVGVRGEVRVPVLDAQGQAMREGGIEASPELAGAELDGLGGGRLEEPAEGEGARRRREEPPGGVEVRLRPGGLRSTRRPGGHPAPAFRAAQSGRAEFMNVPVSPVSHDISLSWLSLSWLAWGGPGIRPSVPVQRRAPVRNRARSPPVRDPVVSAGAREDEPDPKPSARRTRAAPSKPTRAICGKTYRQAVWFESPGRQPTDPDPSPGPVPEQSGERPRHSKLCRKSLHENIFSADQPARFAMASSPGTDRRGSRRGTMETRENLSAFGPDPDRRRAVRPEARGPGRRRGRAPRRRRREA